MAYILINLINLLANILKLLFLVRVIVPFLRLPQNNQLLQFLWQTTEPFLAPVRKMTQRFQGGIALDFSPVIAILALDYIIVPILRLIVSVIF